jgi:hypothetical protein
LSKFLTICQFNSQIYRKEKAEMAKITGYSKYPPPPAGWEGTCNLCKARVETEGNEEVLDKKTNPDCYVIRCPGCQHYVYVWEPRKRGL